MNRRNFIKRGALWVPTIFIPRLIRAQDHANFLKMMAQKQKSSGGGSNPAAFIGNNLDGSGNLVTDSGTDVVSNVIAWGLSFSCPGSGTRVLDQLGVFGSVASGTSHFRLAIYTAAGAFVAQTASTAVSITVAAWTTVSSFLNQAQSSLSPVNLTGGSSYILAVSADNVAGGFNIHFKTIVGGAFNATDANANGFPATLPSPTTTNEEFGVRGHVAAV